MHLHNQKKCANVKSIEFQIPLRTDSAQVSPYIQYHFFLQSLLPFIPMSPLYFYITTFNKYFFN